MNAPVSYTIPGTNSVPHGRNQHYPGVSAFDAQVLSSRAIASEVATARGYRTEGDRLVIPWHQAQGDAGPEQERPHKARPGKDGKLAKYLFKRGAEMVVDVHPYSQPFLSYLDVPIIITESPLKADAIISALMAAGVTRFCVIAVPGVWGWSRKQKLLPCFAGIPMHGRVVYIVFDSDTRTNPKVAYARQRFTEQLRSECGADVHWIDTPTTPEGGKQGPDDALASGLHSAESLLASSYPAPGGTTEINLDALPDDASRIEWLKAKNAYLEAENQGLRHDRAGLIGLFTNPYLKSSLKEALVSTYVEVIQQEADEDGRVEVAAGKIGQDFRESVEVGTEKPKLNEDGSRFLIARSSVKSVIGEAQELNLIDAVTVPREKKRKGQGLPEKVWRVKKPANLAEFLASAVTFATPGVEPRKNRTQSPICPACGVRHSRRVDTICLGCGAVTDTKILEAVELTPDDVDADVQHRRAEQAAHEAHSLEKNPKVVNTPSPAPAPSPHNVSLEKTSKKRQAVRIPICANCSLPRSSDPTPCPNCGAVGRTYKDLSPQPPPREQAEMAGLPSHPSPARWTT